ncbi:MAG: hypothetical protein RIT81_16410 [Deltaproteobacteria bacterium]
MQLAVIDARLAYLDKVADQERRATLRPIDAADAAGTAAGI